MSLLDRNRFRHRVLAPVFFPLGIGLSLISIAQAEDAPVQATIDFRRDVAPLLQERCVMCHRESLALGDLRLDRKELALDEDLIVSGNAKESPFMKRLEKSEAGIRMPPTGASLSSKEKKIFESWINQGAPWPDELVLASRNNHGPEDGETAQLFRDIRDANHQAVRWRLHSNPQLIKATNSDGYTPLLLAAYCSSPQCVKTLLEFDADLEAVTPEGMTALMLSAASPAKCKSLLEAGARVMAQTKDGKTALHYAVSTGDSVAVAKILLSHGAEIDAVDKNKRTPLGYAASEGQTGLLDFLVHRGADPKAVAPGLLARNRHAIELLADNRFYENKGALRGAIGGAILSGDVELARSLLERGAPADQRYASSQTALIRAAYSEAGSLELLQALVAHGADPKSRDRLEKSALDWARTKGATPMVEYLEGLVATKGDAPQVPSPEASEDQAAKGAKKRSPGEAAEAGLRLLQRSNLRFFKKSGCFACHQQPITSVAVGLAREGGFKYRAEPAQQQSQLYSVILEANRKRYLKGGALGGNQDTTGSILFGLSAEGYPRTDATDAMVIQLASKQRDDGSWPTSGHRPPSEYSSISTTAFAIHALNAYSPPGLRREMKKRVATARAWLLKSTPHTVQEEATKLLGLAWSKANAATTGAIRDRLLELQREDGGWSQLATLSSDAYATGLTLFALRKGAQLSPDHAAYQKGVDYLLQTQLADGSWHVQGRTLKFQPYFESGFPHGHDQWISAHATGWAVIALMLDHQ